MNWKLECFNSICWAILKVIVTKDVYMLGFFFTWSQGIILEITRRKKLPFARVLFQFTCSNAGESDDAIHLSSGSVSLLDFVAL